MKRPSNPRARAPAKSCGSKNRKSKRRSATATDATSSPHASDLRPRPRVTSPHQHQSNRPASSGRAVFFDRIPVGGRPLIIGAISHADTLKRTDLATTLKLDIAEFRLDLTGFISGWQD